MFLLRRASCISSLRGGGYGTSLLYCDICPHRITWLPLFIWKVSRGLKVNVCASERGRKRYENLQPSLLILANAGSTIGKIKAGEFTHFPGKNKQLTSYRGLQPQTQLEQYLGDYGVADGASHVVKVNVYPIGAALPEPRRDVLSAVVDGRREAEVFH